MDSAELTRKLEEGLEGLQLLKHPWYVRWENGELSREELRDYAEQYRHFESALPRVLSRLADRLEKGPAKDLVVSNLDDEIGRSGSDPHVDLFDRYIDVLEGSHNATASPAMTELVDSYDGLLLDGPVQALAGVTAYELQAADIAKSKGEGLRRQYGMSEGETEFWDVHATLDVDHAEWSLEAMAQMTDDPDMVVSSAQRTAQAWWRFLDERESLHQERLTA